MGGEYQRSEKGLTENSRSLWMNITLSLGLIFVLISASLLIYMSLPIFNSIYSSRWPSVQGQVISSQAIPNNYPEIIYSYKVSGIHYSGANIRFMGTSKENWINNRWTVNKFPAGKTVPVFYNPLDPMMSVLEPGANSFVFVSSLMPDLMINGLLFGIAWLFLGAYERLKNAWMENGLYYIDYNQIKWMPSELILPISTTIKAPLLAGIMMTLFGGAFLGFLLWNYIGGTIKQGFSLPWTIIFIPFILFPLGFFLGGLSMIFGRKHIEITPEYITCSAKGIFSSKDWKEPISNYEGVATRIFISQKHSNQYFVELRHKKDMGKDIQLWQSWGDGGQADAQLQFSRLLNVPALD